MLPHTAHTPDSAVSAQAPHAVVCSADSQGSQISRAHTGPKRRQQGRERLQRPAAGVALNSRGQKRCRQCPRVARAPRPPTPSYAFLELLDSPLLQPSRKKHKTKSKSRDGQNSRPLSRFARFAFARPISRSFSNRRAHVAVDCCAAKRSPKHGTSGAAVGLILIERAAPRRELQGPRDAVEVAGICAGRGDGSCTASAAARRRPGDGQRCRRLCSA